MQKLLNVIIDSDKEQSESVIKHINKSSYECIFRHFRSYQEFENFKKDPHRKDRGHNGFTPNIIWLRYNMPSVGDDVLSTENSIPYARKLREEFNLTPIVLMHESDSNKSHSVDSIVDRYLNTTRLEQVWEIMNSLVKARRLVQFPSVGIIGFGKHGTAVLEELIHKDFMGDLHVVSGEEAFEDTLKGTLGLDDEKLREYVKKRFGVEKISEEDLVMALSEIPRLANGVTFHHPRDYKSIVGLDLDFLVVTTGEHNELDLRKFESREDFFNSAFRKIDPVIETIADLSYKGNPIIQTNPSGHNLRGAYRKFGLYPWSMTSIPADNRRHKSVIASHLISHYNGLRGIDLSLIKDKTKREEKKKKITAYREAVKNLKPSQIDLWVYGEHGEEFSHLKACKVKGRSLEEIDSDLASPGSGDVKRETEFYELVRKDANAMGLDTMIAAAILDQKYRATPKVVAETIEDFAHLQEDLRHSVYCFEENTGAFTLWRAKAEYKGRSVKIKRSDRLKEEDLTDPYRIKLDQQLQNQIDLVEAELSKEKAPLTT